MKRAWCKLIVGLAWLSGCAASEPVAPGASRSAAVIASIFNLSAAAPAPDAAQAALWLEVWATVHGSAAGPLFPDMTVHSGDRIGLLARTSVAAHVYMIHCGGDQGLSVFPAREALAFAPDRRVALPSADQDLPLRGEPGNEVLYVVASKRPLLRSDPELHAALMGTDPEGEWSCGEDFDALLKGPPPGLPPRSRYHFALRGFDSSDGLYRVARAFADDSGVVVLRLPYQHAP